MTVIVAGAGLAGLAAAHALARAGAAVTILDARDRPGGRVHTVRDGFRGRVHGELGGEFIDASQDEIRRLCAELQLPLVRVLRGGFTHRIRGEAGEYHLSRTRPWSELERLLAPLLRRYRAARGDSASDAVREMAAVSLREWLRQRGATPAQHSMADALRGFFLGDPQDLSVLPLVEQLASGGSPAQAEMYRVDEGSDRLVDALVRASPARLLLRHRITAIAQAVDRVLVNVVDDRGMQQQFESDAVVVALPASTLRDVAITPALPEPQWRAIRALRYGCATKVLVQLAGRSGREGGSRQAAFRGRARAFATDGPAGAFWDGGDPSILVFLGGGSASRTLRDRAARGGAALLSDLCWLGVTGAPVHALHVATWEDDPWARGGYAYLDPGFDPAWRPLLARRAGRLVFAGEHTSERWQGYMNGAIETGLRAAKELLQS